MISDSLSPSLFPNRTAVLATMHQKERVIAPILEPNLGIEIVVPQEINTDEFGTFTRDIKRPGDQLHTARLKAEKAMSLTGLSLGFASEGSFGPHPSLPFLVCDREIVLLRDRSHDLEIIGQAISTETNYCHQEISSLGAALAFAEKIGFPEHGLVAMPEAQTVESSLIFKGITREAQLEEALSWLLKKFGRVHLETDMRAMYNPTRMKVIAQATEDLIDRIAQSCPRCNCPGFVAVEHKAGLPCAWCGSPTNLTLEVIYRCQKCDFKSVTFFPDGQELASPGQCLRCNP